MCRTYRIVRARSRSGRRWRSIADPASRAKRAEAGGASVLGSSLLVSNGCLQERGEPSLRSFAPRGDVLAGPYARGHLVTGQYLARHRDAMDLVGAGVHASGARVPVHLLQREVGRIAKGAVDLDGAVDHVVQDLGAE